MAIIHHLRCMVSPKMVSPSYKNLLDFITFELNSFLCHFLYYTPFKKQVLTLLFLSLSNHYTENVTTEFPHPSQTNQYQLFHIPLLQLLYPKFSVIKVYWITSRLRTLKLNHLTVLTNTRRSNTAFPILTGDSNIENESLRKVLFEDPKYQEPRSINWNYNFKLLMDAVENYERKWIKREQ